MMHASVWTATHDNDWTTGVTENPDGTFCRWIIPSAPIRSQRWHATTGPGTFASCRTRSPAIAVHAPRRGRIGALLLPSRLAQTGGQRRRTAKLLGVSRQGLAKMLRRLGIE
jgi:hypothetical protein